MHVRGLFEGRADAQGLGAASLAARTSSISYSSATPTRALPAERGAGMAPRSQQVLEASR